MISAGTTLAAMREQKPLVHNITNYVVMNNTANALLALGAAPAMVRRMVVGQGLGLIGVGVAVGLAGSFALTRLMASLLYGVTPTDPTTYGGVAALLVVIAVVASWLPARRATRVDPMVALRAE